MLELSQHLSVLGVAQTLPGQQTDAVADEANRTIGQADVYPAGVLTACGNDPKTTVPAQAKRFVTFAALHKLAKLNADVLDLWCVVLRAVPNSRLLVFRDGLRGSVRDYFRDQFARRGFGEDRVCLAHEAGPSGSFLEVYGQIDVALDPFPWGGHATACEALWMGVPVVTLLGNRHAGRMVASVLTQVGLTDLIAATPEEYVAKAAGLANDVERLAALRAGLRERMRASPLCDGRTFTRHLEKAYRTMWHRWCERGVTPR